MFAVAIWDSRQRRLVLARDRFGIKPLHWARVPGGLACASELKALRHAPGFSREIDPDAVEAFLAFNSIPAPLTIYAAARKLPPGHVLVWQEGSDDVVVERFARPAPAAPSPATPEEVLERLRDSVRAHLVSDVPVGGYYTYVADLLAPRVGKLASAARPLIERLPSSSSRAASFDYKAKRFARAATLPPLERHHGWKEVFDPAARHSLFAVRPQDVADPVSMYRSYYSETEGLPELARLQDVDLNVYLPSDLLVKTDRASMAHSLEARVPFLDTAVADLALRLPTRQKVRGFSKKVLLRKAVEPLLPREIVHGRKQGVSIPAAAWLRAELALV